jgi:hypothetical protein
MRPALIALALLAACAPDPRPAADGSGWVRLPPEAVRVIALDSDSLAANHIGATLAAPSRLAGNPAAQARALGFYEFATVALAGPRWAALDASAVQQLRAGRAELRDAFGIRQDAPAQVVLESLFLAGSALSVGDTASAARSFPPGILTGPADRTVALLADPPPLPRVQRASSFIGGAMRAVAPSAGPGGNRL